MMPRARELISLLASQKLDRDRARKLAESLAKDLADPPKTVVEEKH